MSTAGDETPSAARRPVIAATRRLATALAGGDSIRRQADLRGGRPA